MTRYTIFPQLLLLSSLFLSSRAFTTRFDRTTGFVGRQQGQQLRPQHTAQGLQCSPLRFSPSQSMGATAKRCQPPSRRSLLLRSAASDDEDDDEPTESEIAEMAWEAVHDIHDPKWKRILFWYRYNKDGTRKPDEDDGLTFKQKLAKAGLSVLLSYGFVSNMSYCVTVSLAWFGFSKKTGLSPLAPGQWKGFLAVYAGFYVFNNFVRPMRFAMSVGVAPYFERTVKKIQRKTKLSKGASIGIVVFLANVVGTTSFMSLGIYIASLAAGIPVFPPKA